MDTIPFKHKMAAHCETGTVSSVLNYSGMDISEPMAFGIGSGIFFGYFTMRSMPFPTFIVRHKPGYIRKNVSKRLGVKFYEKTFRDHTKAKEELDYLLTVKKIPVAVQVDFFYMEYLPAWFRVHNNVHFIIVTGKEDGKYIVSDCYYPEMAKLSEESMEKGRFAGGMSAPKGFLFYPTYIPEKYDLEKEIKAGIKKSCYNMLKLPIPFLGIKGIRKFAKKVVEWPKLARDIEHLSDEITKINVLLEDQGTGGAGFRFMFATFLRQASEITHNPALLEMSKRMMLIGDGWREISVFAARIGKNRDLGPERMQELSKLIMERADVEEIFFKDLYKMFK